MTGRISGKLHWVVVCALLMSVVGANPQDRKWGVNREIVQASESVYRWGSDNQCGAYIVGTDGIAVVDGHYYPSGTMQWLKEQLADRHDVPVKYVILSHDHPDHVCNYQVFDDTDITIGHKNILPHILRERRSSSAPQITFEKLMELMLGDVTVNLLYFGPSRAVKMSPIAAPPILSTRFAQAR